MSNRQSQVFEFSIPHHIQKFILLKAIFSYLTMLTLSIRFFLLNRYVSYFMIMKIDLKHHLQFFPPHDLPKFICSIQFTIHRQTTDNLKGYLLANFSFARVND